MGLSEVFCTCGERIMVSADGTDHVWECGSCGQPFQLYKEGATYVPLFIDASAHIPDPPEELTLECGCGNALRIARTLYNHRVRCPHCAERMALVLHLDPKRLSYSILARRVEGPSLGDTRVLSAVR